MQSRKRQGSRQLRGLETSSCSIWERIKHGVRRALLLGRFRHLVGSESLTKFQIRLIALGRGIKFNLSEINRVVLVRLVAIRARSIKRDALRDEMEPIHRPLCYRPDVVK